MADFGIFKKKSNLFIFYCILSALSESGLEISLRHSETSLIGGSNPQSRGGLTPIFLENRIFCKNGHQILILYPILTNNCTFFIVCCSWFRIWLNGIMLKSCQVLLILPNPDNKYYQHQTAKVLQLVQDLAQGIICLPAQVLDQDLAQHYCTGRPAYSSLSVQLACDHMNTQLVVQLGHNYQFNLLFEA